MSATARPSDAVPYWPIVNVEALLTSESLARVLAGMGFTMHIGSTTRGAIAWWPPAYVRHSPWRAQMHIGSNVAAKGFQKGAWTADAIAFHDRADANKRARLAELNRAVRDAPVLLMAAPLSAPASLDLDAFAAYAIDSTTGEWHGSGHQFSQFGDDLISLGMVRWQCRYPQAAGRIARLIGLDDIPRVP